MNWHILNDEHEVVETDIAGWVAFGEQGDSGFRIGDDEVGKYRVSTVFLHGIEHPGGMWFETMVFSDDDEGDHPMERYATWDEAVDGHAEWVERAKTGLFR